MSRLIAREGNQNNCRYAAVAISGDTVLLGTPQDIAGRGEPGRAFVFVRQEGEWIEEGALLSNDSAHPNDGFGYAVAVTQDIAAVSVPLEYGGLPGTIGEVWLFGLYQGAWTPRQVLYHQQGYDSGLFGTLVTSASNFIAVGGPSVAGVGGTNPGAIYVFAPTEPGYQLQAVLKPNAPRYGSAYAHGLATDGTRIVSGGLAVGDAVTVPTAWVYSQQGTTWAQEAVVAASDAAVSVPERGGPVLFPVSVAVWGDVLALGVGGPVRPARAYVFAKRGETWEQDASLQIDGNASNSSPMAIALSAERLVFGAPNDAVYVFSNRDGIWRLEIKLAAPDIQDGGEFGTSVAINGGRVVVGGSTRGECLAYVFEPSAP